MDNRLSRDLKSNNFKKRNIQVQHKEFGFDWLMIKIKNKNGNNNNFIKASKKTYNNVIKPRILTCVPLFNNNNNGSSKI